MSLGIAEKLRTTFGTWTGKSAVGIASGLILGSLFYHGTLSDRLWWLSFVVFVPYWILPPRPMRQEFVSGLLFGIAFNLTGLFWLERTMVRYGHLPPPLAFLGLSLLAFYMSLYPAFFWALLSRIERGLPLFLVPWAGGALWTVTETLKGILFTGFPWNPMGSLLFGHPPFLNFAATVGTTGLSFLVVLANGWVAIAVGGRFRAGDGRVREGWRSPLVWAPLCLVLELVLWGTGGHIDRPEAKETLTVPVGLIQGNIPQDQKWTRPFLRQILETYLALSRSAVRDGARLLVWPETALPVPPEYRGPDLADTLRQIRSLPVPIITGTLGVASRNPLRFSNDATALIPGQPGRNVYRKRHLVPFGEYIPIPALFEWLRPITGITGDLVSGTETRTFQVPYGDGSLTVGPAICYEALYPSLMRTIARKNPDVFVVLSDDAWFGRTEAPYQLFRQSLIRAVENGVPMIRVANTGVSGVMEPNGTLMGETPLFEPRATVVRVPVGRESTFYRRHGEWVFRSSLLFLVVLSAFRGMSAGIQFRKGNAA
jgi:apolipoprotein N-acyltransferase